MATKTTLTLPPPKTQSTDIQYITNDPQYMEAVERVNEMIKYYRDRRKLPPSFPNTTQHRVLVRMHRGKDVAITFRTGGGKTSMFYMYPIVKRLPNVYLFVVPLLTIMKQHKETFLEFGYPPHTVITMEEHNVDEIIALIQDHDGELPIIIIGSPEAFVNDVDGLCKKLPSRLRRKIVGLMIDEVQMIEDWGHNFRIWFAQLINIRKLNPLMSTVTASGSTNAETREAIRNNLGMDEQSSLVGPLDRMDLSWTVSESSSMPPRTPIETEIAADGGGDAAEDEMEGEEEEDAQIYEDRASDTFKLEILKKLKRYSTEGFLVYCESVEQCEKFAKELCDFFAKRKSDVIAQPFYRKAPKWMEAVLESFDSTETACVNHRVLCCTVVLGMGINPSCNKKPVRGAFLKRLCPNLSMTKQFADRAHRNYLNDSSFGIVVAVVDIKDFRRHMKRAFELQGSLYDDSQRELGKRLEDSARAMFTLLTDPNRCIQEMINEALGGSNGSLSCTRVDGGACCNCRRKKASSLAAQKIRSNAISVMQTSVAVKVKQAALKLMAGTYMIPANKSSRPSRPGWTTLVNLLDGFTPAITIPTALKPKSYIVKVLVDNLTVTDLLKKLVMKELKKYRYGIPFASLISTVEKGTGKNGLTHSQTRWCLTQFLYQGMIEEELDASPDPEGFERKTSRKVHTKVTAQGHEQDIWPTVKVHDRCGYFI